MLDFFRRPTVIISLVSAGLFLIFLSWVWLTVIPIAAVETQYQYQRFLAAFGVHDLREFFIPNFKAFDFEGDSKYKEYGLVIPTLYLDEKVIPNVDPNDAAAYTAALKQGIAHASGTAFPDNPGLGYYFAHSTTPEFINQFKAVFYLLGKLKAGDKVYLWHENHKYEYVVTKTQIYNPDDISFLHQQYDQETIVLQTCWPPGTTQKRLLVFAQRQLN